MSQKDYLDFKKVICLGEKTGRKWGNWKAYERAKKEFNYKTKWLKVAKSIIRCGDRALYGTLKKFLKENDSDSHYLEVISSNDIRILIRLSLSKDGKKVLGEVFIGSPKSQI